MDFKTRLFLGDRLLEPAEYKHVQIHSQAVDLIVNDIYEKAHGQWEAENFAGEEELRAGA